MLTKEKPVEVLPTPSTGHTKSSKRHFTSHATAAEAQIARLAALLQSGPRHTHQLRSMGISHPAARVLDLQKRGWSIASVRIPTVDSDGHPHARVALYTLVSMPASSRESRPPADTTGDLFAHAEREPT